MGTELHLADHVVQTYYDGPYRYVRYYFPFTGVTTFRQGSNVSTGTGLDLTPGSGDVITATSYPFGTLHSSGPPLTASNSPYLNVADFRPSAVLNIQWRFGFAMSYKVEAVAAGDLQYTYYVQYTLNCYKADFGYAGSVSTGYVAHFVELINPGNDVPQYVRVDKSVDWELELPENCKYVVPVIHYKSDPTDTSESILIRDINFDPHAFEVHTRFDTVLNDSLTMERIENGLGDLNEKADQTNQELGELNDKADTLINGTPEMDETITDMSGEVQDQDEQMGIVEDTEKAYLDAWESTNKTLKSEILNFLNGEGWTQLGALLAPILTWEHNVTIMFMVVAFVNLSVILFGR